MQVVPLFTAYGTFQVLAIGAFFLLLERSLRRRGASLAGAERLAARRLSGPGPPAGGPPGSPRLAAAPPAPSPARGRTSPLRPLFHVLRP